jgi:tetratricopeptide (TPR) repeat protein
MEGRAIAPAIGAVLLISLALQLPLPVSAAGGTAAGASTVQLWTAAQPVADATALLAQARQATTSGDAAAAVRAYEQLLDLGPVNKDVRLEYADALRAAGRLEDAVKQYDLVLHAPDVDQQVREADAAMARQDYAQCESLLVSALAESNEAALWIKLGQARAAQSKWREAATAFGTADELETLASAYRIEYADALRQSGQLEKAVEQYNLALANDTAPAQSSRPAATPAAKPAAKADPSAAGFRTDETATPSQALPDTSIPLVKPDRPRDEVNHADSTSTAAHEVPPTISNDATDVKQPAAGQFFLARDDSRIESMQSGGGVDNVIGGGSTSTQRQAEPTPEMNLPVDFAGWITRAEQMSEAKEWPEAVKAYEEALKLEALNDAQRIGYAEALRQAGQLTTAEEEFNRVLHNDASNIDAKIGLAKVLAMTDKLEEAMYLLDQCETDAEAVRRARIARIYAYFVNDYVQEAWRDIGDLLAREPWNSEALELVKQTAPWENIKAALAKQPGNEELIALMEDIIKAEMKASETEPSDAQERAEWYYQRGDIMRAQREFEALISADPTDARSWQRLAQIYQWDSDWENALDAYDKYLALMPGDYWAMLRHGQVLLYAGHAAEAAEELWTLISDTGVPIEVYEQALLAYAVALNATGRSKEALQWFEEALVFAPHNVEVLAAYASALSGQHRYDEALVLYEKAIHEDPGSDMARLGYAQVYSWKGEQQYAAQLFDDISMDSTYYLPSRIGKAYAYLWDGQRGRALEVAREAERLNPSDPDVIALLQRLNEKPDPVLASTWKQGHDTEDNDTRVLSTTLTVPLSAAGAQLTLKYDDIKLDNTGLNQETDGSVTGLTLELPVGDHSRLQGRADYVDLRNQADPGVSEWNWGARFRTDVNHDWSWGAGYSDDVMYETTRLARNGIRLKQYMVTTDFRVGDDNTRFIAEFERGDFSDGNKRNRWYFDLRKTAEWQGRGRLNYGLAARLIDYALDTNSGYWDPDNYRYGEIYADWLDMSDHKLLLDGGLGIGFDEATGKSGAVGFRYNVGVRAPLYNQRLWLKAGFSSSEGGEVEQTTNGYKSKQWYFNAEYHF